MNIIVTGGGGFLGKALAFRLRDDGHRVVSLSRKRYPELEERGISCYPFDLGEAPSNLQKAFVGADAVFHVAAKVDAWGKYEDFYRVNVLGTRAIVDSCLEFGVGRLIYTSSPSVVIGTQDIRDADESIPYPTRYLAHYPRTKAMAERIVIEANSERLWSLALRPHIIWGPGDTHIVPMLLERAKDGKLPKIGDGSNRVDVSYIEDCVEAHVRALHALESTEECRGKAFFISQGEPVVLWDWIGEILERNGIEPPKRTLSPSFAMAVAAAFELSTRLLELVSGRSLKPPRLTRFLVSQLSRDHFFDITSARDLLSYEPRYSIAEAMDKTFGPARRGRIETQIEERVVGND